MTSSKVVQLPLDNYVEGELPFIMALDPGGTTGWAWFDPNDASIYCGQLHGSHHLELYDFLKSVLGGATTDAAIQDRAMQIVCESFQFRQFTGFDKSKVELDSVEYIGVVKLFSQRFAVPVQFQTASVAKHFVSDEKLRRLDWYKPTAGLVHTRDALRHLVYFLVVTKKVRTPFIDRWFVGK